MDVTCRLPSRGRCTGTRPRRDLPPHPRGGRGGVHDRDAQLEAAHDCWYRGFVAEEIVRFPEREWLDSSGERHAGLLAGEDLRGWAPTWEEPLSVDYRGYEVFKAGPWSQGPVFLQQLALLEGFDLGAMGQASAEWVHTVPSARSSRSPTARPGTATRNSSTCRSTTLLSREYADERRALVGEEASRELRPARPRPEPRRRPRSAGAAPAAVERRATSASRRAATPATSTSSTAPATWSRPRRAAAGCERARSIPGLGFCLGTRAQMFWLEEGLPTSLEPGKRPADDALADTGARGGEPCLALGTPGGDQQDQWTLHVFLAHVHHGLDLQAAIDAPNHHTEALPVVASTRGRASRGTSRSRTAPAPRRSTGCASAGTTSRYSGPWTLGRVTAVGRERDGILKAGANPRGRQGYAAGR